ncbi:MAG: outer membrane protein assembly factor BamA [Syntrophobacteraceae bacterium]
MRKLILLCLVMISAVAWAEDQPPKVAVMPFAVHALEKLPDVQQSVSDLLVRQLGAVGANAVDAKEVLKILKPGEVVQTEAQAKAAAEKLNVDFVLFGSFNQVGKSISLDTKLVDVSGRKKTEVLFAEEKGMENLAAVVDAIAKQMAVRLMSKAVIADVQVKGNERIEAEAVKLNAKSKKGDVLRPEVVREDIKAIYKTGFFEKVEAETSDSPEGKVLTFVVQENPTVQEIKVTGAKKLKEKDILAAISTKVFSVLQKNVVNEDVQKIFKLYEQKGYCNAEVKSNIEFPKDPRKAVVLYDIKENNVFKIKKISFTGNKKLSARKLRGIMQTKEKSFILSLVTDRGILQKDILDTDIDRISIFYHDKGFMNVKVGIPKVERRDDGFYIDIPIEEGERYKIKDVKIAGDPLDEPEKKLEKLAVKPSAYFSREALRNDTETITKTYMDQGYAHTEVAPEVKREPDELSANVVYEVKKGEKVRIGKIFITGNTKTRDKVIRREMKITEGDFFNSTKMEKSLTRLKKMDYFEDVEIVPVESGQPGIMNLQVKVKEKFTGAISVGGGYSSDEGFFTSGEISQRNLFGKGEYASIKAHLGQDTARYVASFTEPWIFDTPLSAGIDVYDWRRVYSDFTKDAVGFKLRASYPFGQYSRFSEMYTYEIIDVSDVDSSASYYIRSQEGNHVKGSLTTGIERDTTDHPFMPTQGSINSLTIEWASEILGGDNDFIKSEIFSGWYFPIYWKFVGFVRGQAGAISNIGGEEIPIFERYFLGGINSLRGWEWGDVSPIDPETGDKIGGLNYGVATAELLFPIIENMGMRGVVFFDAGNAYLEKWDFSDIRKDAGVGIRWNSPMGPLRIEWGYNLDPKEDEDRFQWQFSAGAFF